MAVTYKVQVDFEVTVEDEGGYPDSFAVKQRVYDAIEMPGYMLRGLKVVATNAWAVRKE